MSLWDNIVGAIGNFFSAPKVQSAWPTSPTPSYGSTPSYSSQITRQSYPSYQSKPSVTPAKGRDYTRPAIASQAKGVGVQGPTYSAPSQQTQVPSSTTSQQPSSPLSSVTQAIGRKVGQFTKNPVATTLGDVAKAGQLYSEALVGEGGGPMGRLGPGGTSVTQRLQDIAGSISRGEPVNWGEVSGLIGKAIPAVVNPQQWLINALTHAGEVSGFQGGSQNLLQQLQASPDWNIARTGLATRNLPSGQITPKAARTVAVGGRPSPAMTPSATRTTGAQVPSPQATGTLPANLQGLTPANVNPQIAQAITPQAIASLGQLLLQSLVTPQSSLTGITPGLASALWGAPTAFSPFGGYQGMSSPPPGPAFVNQPKNIPPLPQPVSRG